MHFQIGDLVCDNAIGPHTGRVYEVTGAYPRAPKKATDEQTLVARILMEEVGESITDSLLGSRRFERNVTFVAMSEMVFLARIANGESYLEPEAWKEVK